MPEEFVEDIIAAEEVKETPTEKAAEVAAEDTASALKAVDASTKEQEVEKPDNQQVEDTKDQETIESLAEKLGWNKDHQGEDKVDATTYILRSREIQDSMRDHNKDLKGQVGSLKDSITALQEHNENVYKAEVRKLESELASLKKEKRAAVELADVEKVDALDEQIETIQKDLNTPKEPKTESTNPIYDEWVKDNQWYLNDSEMAQYAETIADQYPGAPADRVYSIIRQKVQEVFPEKFDVAPKPTPKPVEKETEVKNPVGPNSPVESASNREKSSTFTVNDLSESQRATMRQFVNKGIMTEQQYVDDIAKMQEG
jgi:hypothetical protein